MAQPKPSGLSIVNSQWEFVADFKPHRISDKENTVTDTNTYAVTFKQTPLQKQIIFKSASFTSSSSLSLTAKHPIILGQEGYHPSGSVPAHCKGIFTWTTLLPSAIIRQQGGNRGQKLGCLSVWMQTDLWLARSGSQSAHLACFCETYLPAARLAWNLLGNPSEARNETLDQKLTQNRHAKAAALLLTHHGGAAKTRAVPEYVWWTQDSYPAGTTGQLKCQMSQQKEGGWKWRACICPPFAHFQTNH